MIYYVGFLNIVFAQELHISYCISLTDEAVEGILSCCPQIQILLFHGCPNLTGNSIVVDYSTPSLF